MGEHIELERVETTTSFWDQAAANDQVIQREKEAKKKKKKNKARPNKNNFYRRSFHEKKGR